RSEWLTEAELQVSAAVGWPVISGSVLLGHSTEVSVGNEVKTGGVVSRMVMIWSWLAIFPQASVAVQVRVIVRTTLLEQLPSTTRFEKLSDTALQVSVAIGWPVNSGAVLPGHSSVRSAGKLE